MGVRVLYGAVHWKEEHELTSPPMTSGLFLTGVIIKVAALAENPKLDFM